MPTSQSHLHYKRGVFAVLVGPDGCGKSTVTSRISESYRQNFSGLHHFHWRPNLLPKLNPRPTNTTPPDELSKASRPSALKKTVSFIRFLYYWLDFVLGYWVIIYPKLRTNHLVIGERYFLDVIVNPGRYGFYLPPRLIRAFSALVPNADIIILLSDKPERIFERKQELTISQITQQLSAYNSELSANPNAVIVETTQSAEKVAESITEELVDTQKSLCSGDKWRAFPNTSRTKIIFQCGTSLRSALDLYQPYSKAGQYVKWLACILPNPLAKIIFSRAAPVAHRLARPIIETLETGDPQLERNFGSIAISLGTPGPHQKPTAQLITSDKCKVYVKYSDSTATRPLIENEATVLQYLASIPAISGMTPTLLHLHSSDNCSAISQSGPIGKTRRRAGHPTSQDIDFLCRLFSGGSRYLSSNELAIAWKLHERLEILTNSDHGQAVSDIISMAWNFSRESFGDVKINTGPCHGDYAPWNTLCKESGEVFVFDWEYGTLDGPALGDLFHSIFNTQILIHGHDASGITACLAHSSTPLCSPVKNLASRLNIKSSDIPKYLLLHMIWQCLLRAESHLQKNSSAHSFSEDPLMNSLVEAITYLTSTGLAPPRPHMIASAYACESDQGSEPGVGWNWAQLLSEQNEVWVFTRANNKQSIQAGLRETPNPYLHFEYLDLPKWATFWKKGSRGVRTYYYLWQIAAFRRARLLHAKAGFEHGHHVTFVNDWLWSFLSLLNIPFVWGPIGSNSPSPLALLPHTRARAQEMARLVIQQFFRWFDPLHWLTISRASTILTINAQIANSIPLKWVAGKKTCVEPAIAIGPARPQENTPRTTSRLKVLYAGKLLPIKGCHLAVEAFADFSLEQDNAELIILGDGPERKNIEKSIDRLGIKEKVTILGWRPLEEVPELMNSSDIFLFPTMEGAGLAVLEAMSHGLPCICLDFGGPGTFLNRECARLIPVARRKLVVRDLANALRELSDNADLRHALGEKAKIRVNETYSWPKKRELIKRLSTTGALQP